MESFKQPNPYLPPPPPPPSMADPHVSHQRPPPFQPQGSWYSGQFQYHPSHSPSPLPPPPQPWSSLPPPPHSDHLPPPPSFAPYIAHPHHAQYLPPPLALPRPQMPPPPRPHSQQPYSQELGRQIIRMFTLKEHLTGARAANWQNARAPEMLGGSWWNLPNRPTREKVVECWRAIIA